MSRRIGPGLRVGLATLALASLAHRSSGKAECGIRVSPQTGFAPLAVRVTATVEADPRNRLARLSVDGYTSTDVELAGEQGPRLIQRTWERVEEGEWQVAVRVGRNDGSTCLAAVPLRVIGRMGE